jgi:L,D-transpeptidase ErfK/SrfK
MKYIAFAVIMLFTWNVHASAVTVPQSSGEHLKGAITPKPDAPKTPIKTASAETKKPETKQNEPDPSTKKNNDADDADASVDINFTKPDSNLSFIGNEEVIEAAFEDTLLELGRKYNVGYVEIVAANPNVEPFLPGKGTKIIIPNRHLLPDAERMGLVINLAEMRLYNFVNDPEQPTSHPIGIGRDGLNTPLGITKITRKKDGPSWRPTARMKKEDPELPDVVLPGPENPLGTHALYLGWPQYLIHGTHKPLGVGRRVSSGCLRMYPEDIIQIFRDVPVGTQVNVIKQPIKMAWIDDMLYIEAHAEDELADSIEAKGKIKEYRVPETLFLDLKNIAGYAYGRLDWETIRTAVKTRNGRPTAILLDDNTNIDVTEDILNPKKAEKSDNDKLQSSESEKRTVIKTNN